MGWRISVEFKTSNIHGTGVFAKFPIKAGTRLWEYDHTMNVSDRAELRSLSPERLRFALHGGYLHAPSDKFLWYTDGMQFMNHAETGIANVGLGFWPELSDDHCVALRDIEPGEELLEDYAFWANGGLSPGHWLHQFYMEFCREHYAFLTSLEPLKIPA